MASVFDVAKYILHKKGKMSTWKLQKLCYYSQAWNLAWTGNEIFPEEFEAWRNGPVCPALYQVHKGRFVVGEDDIPYGDRFEVCGEDKASIDVVLQDYGEMEPYELREQTHREEPWILARGGISDFENSETVITKESMGSYYGSL